MRIEIGANEAGQRLDKFLRKLLKDVPLSAIFKALRKGDIRVNGKKQKEKYTLEIDDVIEIRYIQSQKMTEKKKDTFIKVDASGLKTVYEDNNMLVVEKWPGVLVHPDSNKKIPTLTDYVLSYLNEKGDYTPETEITFTPAPCNRLDRNTSGVVIFGKNFESLRQLNEIIREGKVKKYYMALVKGRIKDGLYKGYILKNEETNISRIYDKKVKDSKEISMEIKTLESDGAFSLLEIDLITGRSHQIRAHLSHLGNPIIGDYKYGDRALNSHFFNKYGLDYQFLYAYKLNFKNTDGKLEYLKNKIITQALPPIFKKIKYDTFKIRL
ncbi:MULTISPECIES: RluA family pseudouridine synthase [Clostridium]|uniref:Pseudouridine synthase n=1 Tax=Clostridium nitritogenes TaxID=83340 RepID=A0ABP3X0G6_9CLOT|nr:RluA family pseudouridine synthase [Clostridium baratii]AQM59943.1 23S rRNA pseudouridine(955/2504/2580) synthase [Clostridium baratii]KJU72632.1 RluA family pseudouridine synthase [Clostridium baratii]MBS6005659.1 RluA family pseudouridine synthase [Clostridium baratii]MBS6042060.1 RluA family pseudouridine synthase [Clostridium baratii]MBT9831239.1 RluA family pseudouridine synthase [Clostridium baratii]